MRVAAAARKAWTAALGLGLPVGFGLWTRLLGAELPAPGFTPESRGEHALRGVLAHVRPGTTLTNATIGGTGQTLSLGSDNNTLDGNDTLIATGAAITGTVTTGSGSDTISLSGGSSITGDVTLGINADTTVSTDTF